MRSIRGGRYSLGVRANGVRAIGVPLVTAAAVLAGSLALGGVRLGSAFADQHPALPARTPLQLLEAVQASRTDALSGTVTETAHWGLPSLPGAGDAASLDWQGLLTGSHTVRVWLAGPARQRLAVLGSLSESDIVRNGPDLWTYTSATNSVSHTRLPAKPEAPAEGAGTPDGAATLTPDGAARRLLAAITPSTTVSVDPTQRVAGRSAYTLVLAPRDSRSTVRKVEIALDSRYFVPLRVRLFGTGSTAAFDTGFTRISFRTPAASTFQFHPPAGAHSTPAPFGLPAPRPGGQPEPGGQPDHPGVSVLGAGWTSVLDIPADRGLPPVGSPQPGVQPERRARSPYGMLNTLTSPIGNTGDRLLRTSLVNALLTADGRIFIGAVSPALLQAAAAGTYP